MPIRLVLFDLDDTLYPESDFVFSGFRRVAQAVEEKFGIERSLVFGLLTREFFIDRRLVIDRVLRVLGLYCEGLVRELVELYRTHNPQISLYEDARIVIPILKEHQMMLGIVTDGHPVTQRLKVQALQIEEYFDKIVYTWELGLNCSKPSIVPFVKILTESSVSPKEAIFVGDNLEKDFKGPKDIGMKSVQVLREGIYKNAVAPDQSYEPDFRIFSLTELFDIIRRLDSSM
uniref:HAD family hydrolase n=1 Tax=Candidatus Caldatribacterium saccharofermentans TaxID=1454753 RepID=A0A7V4TFB5_9BACT